VSTVDRKKVGRRSRNKGNGYENKIAKVLGDWWCGDPASFKRRPRSGGWPTKHAEGDLVGVTEKSKMFPFVIDTKKREGWRFEHLICGSGPFVEWWDDICDIAHTETEERLRLLIVSKNHDKDYVIFADREMDLLSRVDHTFEPRFDFRSAGRYTETLYVMVLGDFLALDAEKLQCLLS